MYHVYVDENGDLVEWEDEETTNYEPWIDEKEE